METSVATPEYLLRSALAGAASPPLSALAAPTIAATWSSATAALAGAGAGVGAGAALGTGVGSASMCAWPWSWP